MRGSSPRDSGTLPETSAITEGGAATPTAVPGEPLPLLAPAKRPRTLATKPCSHSALPPPLISGGREGKMKNGVGPPRESGKHWGGRRSPARGITAGNAAGRGDSGPSPGVRKPYLRLAFPPPCSNHAQLHNYTETSILALSSLAALVALRPNVQSV